jgi:putative zinc finger/helix-turn-helix YgiT family protein
MTGFCPHCEEERELVATARPVEYSMRGDFITVQVPMLRCSACGKEFEPPDGSHDPLELAYAEYRRRHNLVQPSDIREFRHSIGLTQKELSKLLGWGAVTLARYENGALQDEAHDRALRLAMHPESLLRLLQDRPDALPPQKQGPLTARLRDQITEQQIPLMHLFEDRLASYDPDEYSGYRRFDIDKLFNSIFLAALTDVEGALAASEKPIGDFVGEVLTAVRPPDIAVFDTSELKILSLVQEHFAQLTAKQMSDLSHQEEGFRQTRDGDLISYSYAAVLSL